MKKLEYILVRLAAGQKEKNFSRDEKRIIAALTMFSLMGLLTLLTLVYQVYDAGNFTGTSANLVTVILITLFIALFRITGNLVFYKTAITSLAGLFFLYLAATGGHENTGFLWCYIFPPLSFYILGQRIGIIINLIIISGYAIIFFLPGVPFYTAEYNPAYPFRFVFSMVFTTVVVFFLEFSREQAKKKQLKLIDELQSAVSEVKTLSGLLPICSQCKKIRDDSGYWDQLEEYLLKHSNAEFTHSLCDDCADQLYGNEKWYKKK